MLLTLLDDLSMARVSEGSSTVVSWDRLAAFASIKDGYLARDEAGNPFH